MRQATASEVAEALKVQDRVGELVLEEALELVNSAAWDGGRTLKALRMAVVAVTASMGHADPGRVRSAVWRAELSHEEEELIESLVSRRSEPGTA